ncbi:MAG: InlB B-repeat-containing protein [Anaerolineales bacterium]|nr:InlB B-repeat-containing protein [Anaerolineales bacterium]
MQWNTFLGGSGYDVGTSIVVDGSDNVYMAGTSNATWGAPVRAYSAANDAFAVQLDSSGGLQWNTFLGGSEADVGNSIAVDGSGNVYVAGDSSATWGAPMQAYSASIDAFVAVLAPPSYMVTFNTNGGSGSMSPLVASTSTALTANVFTRTGYTFAGWNTLADGTGTPYTDGASYPFTADVTLYAQWTVATYTVTFNKDGGTGTTDPITGVAYNATVTLPTNPTKLGNNFGGWYTAINGGGTQFTAATPVTANITVYAKWTADVVITPIFIDVPYSYWANSYIERLYSARITSGCSTVPLNYCPDSTVTRAQMAVFLLKGIHGSSYAPPAVGVSTGFGDVAADYWAAAWIKQLAAEGITSGCGNGNYCPDQTVTRAQMAVFLLKAKYGSSYTPPAVGVSTGFNDVATNYWAAAFIKQLVADSITSGCGSNNYCPDSDVTRAQMAVFLVKTFNLP